MCEIISNLGQRCLKKFTDDAQQTKIKHESSGELKTHKATYFLYIFYYYNITRLHIIRKLNKLRLAISTGRKTSFKFTLNILIERSINAKSVNLSKTEASLIEILIVTLSILTFLARGEFCPPLEPDLPVLIWLQTI